MGRAGAPALLLFTPGARRTALSDVLAPELRAIVGLEREDGGGRVGEWVGGADGLSIEDAIPDLEDVWNTGLAAVLPEDGTIFAI